MNVIYGLLAISILVALVFFGLFIFSVKKGQFDDDYTPSVRMLFEDELVQEKDIKKNIKKDNKTTKQPKQS
jgi:cbb3-type cytochrome oxidase maturation protein